MLRLEPLRDDFFPELDDEPYPTEIAIEGRPSVSFRPKLRPPQEFPLPHHGNQRIPPRVAAEVPREASEPTIVAPLAARVGPGTTESNAQDVGQRLARAEHAASPDPGDSAAGNQPAPSASRVAASHAPKNVAAHNPWVLNRVSDALGIFGMGLVCWLALQMLSAGALAWGAMLALGDLWLIGWIASAGLVLAADWRLWLRVRGRLYTAALSPALVVLTVLVMLGIVSVVFRVVTSGTIPGVEVEGTSSPF